MARFKQVALIGLGLIGGSLGMAIRRRRLAAQVVGISRRASTLAQATRLGAIDRAARTMEDAVRGADIVVLATPVDDILPTARRLAPFLAPGAILTDVASTKARVVSALERVVPRGVAVVGGHPLAGSEQRGIAAARADLFDGSLCVLTRTARTDPAALRVVAALWRPLVRRVAVMSPQEHDACLAAISHLPHLVAFALVNATPSAMRAMAPRSFLDATRVAKSDPNLWDDIFLSNTRALPAAVARFDQAWRDAKRLLREDHRAALRQWLRRAQRARQALSDE